MTKTLLFFILLFISSPAVFAHSDTVIVPLIRQTFHERIAEEQKKLDKADGKLDGLIKVSSNPEINFIVTNVMMKKIKDLEDSIELNIKIPNQKEKVNYLSWYF